MHEWKDGGGVGVGEQGEDDKWMKKKMKTEMGDLKDDCADQVDIFRSQTCLHFTLLHTDTHSLFF